LLFNAADFDFITADSMPPPYRVSGVTNATNTVPPAKPLVIQMTRQLAHHGKIPNPPFRSIYLTFHAYKRHPTEDIDRRRIEARAE